MNYCIRANGNEANQLCAVDVQNLIKSALHCGVKMGLRNEKIKTVWFNDDWIEIEVEPASPKNEGVK